jgi:DNA-binding NarL/FixJ family response regulator
MTPRLTRRELDVLRLIAHGDTNREIAARLVIAEGTVKSHVKRILRKLHAANRTEAALRAVEFVQAGHHHHGAAASPTAA